MSKTEQKINPTLKAIIREDECIGCTKCIRACPTDAIIGAAKLMHTVVTDACTGCELCVSPCPVDCIEMKTIPLPNAKQLAINKEKWALRRKRREQRLVREAKETTKFNLQTLLARKTAIAAAIQRVKAKKRTFTGDEQSR